MVDPKNLESDELVTLLVATAKESGKCDPEGEKVGHDIETQKNLALLEAEVRRRLGL